MSREALFNQLRAVKRFDLAVVGGGATGLGVALNAAQRGFSVVLLEAFDFASGTSSRSTKLLHGGVRYLAQGNIRLVSEALHERSVLMEMAPHLAQPLPFVMPIYRYWQIPFYGIGLKLYDLLAGRKALGKTQILNRQETLAALPGVEPEGLIGGVQYWDGQFEDARFALSLAKQIQRLDGLPINYARVTHVAHTESSPSFSIQVQDQMGGQTLQLEANALVNATGVWVDALRQLLSPHKASHLVAPSQGVHIVVGQEFLPSRHALLVPKTSDGRVLFAVPWLGSLVIGTTDTPRQDLPLHPKPFEEELTFLLTEASKALLRPVQRSDVKSVWVGLRPLVALQDSQDTQTLSREHTIVKDSSGLVSVTGGKWTTFRVMAEDTLQACFEAGVLPRQPLQDSRAGRRQTNASVSLTLPPGAHLYGEEQALIAQLPGADHTLFPGFTEAMVRYAARNEWATCVEDILARRSRLLFLDAALARDIAPQVAAILFQETGLDPKLEDFIALTEQYQMPVH